MIKNVFFDVMGVVCTVGDDTNDLLIPFIQRFNKTITRQEINEFYLEASLGKITSKQFWLNVGVEENEIKCVEERYLNENLTVDTDVVDTIKSLKERNYKIGLLSNDVSEWSGYLRKKFNLDNLLDYCVISGEVHLRKPDTAIYQYVINECEVDPKESVFIDDRIKNLIPAKELGFKVILFDGNHDYDNITDYDKINCGSEIPSIIENINGNQ